MSHVIYLTLILANVICVVLVLLALVPQDCKFNNVKPDQATFEKADAPRADFTVVSAKDKNLQATKNSVSCNRKCRFF